MEEEISMQDILNKINNILEKISFIQQEELSVISKFYSYEDFNSMFSKSISLDEYSKLKSEIEQIDQKHLTQQLININKLLENLRNSCTISWKKYNSSYKNFLKNKLDTLINTINSCNAFLTGTDIPYNLISNYLNFYNIIININTNKEIMEYFSFIDKNYVIFGKNGAGKTRLLNYIRDNYFNSNSYVIPSDREIRFGNLSYIRMDYQTEYQLQSLFNHIYSSVYPNDILTLNLRDKILEELQNENSTLKLEDGTRLAKTFYKFLEIFNNLGLDRKIKLNTGNDKLLLYNETLSIEPYYIKDGSDGEKSIVQLILFILLCPQNSFVFIDEPESHFNTALLNELFNLLEKERNDIVFIYCTHNVDFIELRENSQLIYLENFDGNNWNIKEVDSFENISIENIINIVGTKKNILFIESEKEKLDYKFYTALFPNFKIIPVTSCNKVIDSCKSLNDSNFLNLNRKAFGIIDNDFRTDEEISKYLESKIFTLKYNEIENLLLSPLILEYICNKHELMTKLESFKTAVITMATQGKNGIKKDFINKSFAKFQKTGHISTDDFNDIENEIDKINTENKTKFIEVFNQFSTELDNALSAKNYDEIIQKYPNKGFITCLKKLGIQEDTYFNWILNSLSSDNTFREKVINTLFGDFFN